MSWEALPPRRKQRRVDTSQPTEVEVITTSNITINDTTNLENEEKVRKENIKELLAATDGCPGEFYECKL